MSAEINTYWVGQKVRVTAAFTDVDDTAIDPDVVKLSVCDPSEVVTTYVYDTDEELVRDSEGNYSLDIDVDEEGTWYYRWWATGAGQSSVQHMFEAKETIGT